MPVTFDPTLLPKVTSNSNLGQVSNQNIYYNPSQVVISDKSSTRMKDGTTIYNELNQQKQLIQNLYEERQRIEAITREEKQILEEYKHKIRNVNTEKN